MRLIFPRLASRTALRRPTTTRSGLDLTTAHSRFASSQPLSTSRISRIEARLPRFLRRYMQPLRNAPLSHITAFLLLHELTAIVPLFGLAAAFHYSNWLPPYVSEWGWVQIGIEKFGRYLRKKGWLGDEEEGGKARWYGRGEGGVRVVLELATAWAITKALLPLRLVLSVWGTPWFAQLAVLPLMGMVGRVFRRRGAMVAASPAAGTGAVGAGVTSHGTSARASTRRLKG